MIKELDKIYEFSRKCDHTPAGDYFLDQQQAIDLTEELKKNYYDIKNYKDLDGMVFFGVRLKIINKHPIKLIYEDKPTPKPMFKDVQENQLFVAINGSLYQKLNNKGCRIAMPNGILLSGLKEFDPDEIITKILPASKIEY